jgi:hypothetical protein
MDKKEKAIIQMMEKADEVMDYLGWKEIDLDDIVPMYEAILIGEDL